MGEFILDLLSSVVVRIVTASRRRVLRRFASRFPGIDPSVLLGPSVVLMAPPGGIAIGKRTYVNDAIISATRDHPVTIGESCAIGYRVSIKAVTHDPDEPAPDSMGRVKHRGAAIIIGNGCWIGDNVFIREGVVLGDGVIVGANSVVTKSFPDGAVIGGVPARPIR